MDPRTSDPAGTRTLPLTGEGALPVSPEPPAAQEAPAWLDEARASVPAPGKYLAFEEPSGRDVVPVQREWTRIGRSLAADVRFDDATVSRRHALIVNQPDGTRVLDDRSLNGVYVNGRRVEWSPLRDGDQVVVGRHTLYFIDTTTAGAAAEPAEPALAAE